MNTIVEWVLDLMDRIGGPGIALGIFLENVFPPIPSEVILPMAGFAASLGRLSVVEAIIWTTIGSVVGATVSLLMMAAFAQDTDARTLAEVIEGADLFLGLSGPGVLKPEMVARMAPRPIIFALANPNPEIDPDAARASVLAALARAARLPVDLQHRGVVIQVGDGALDVHQVHTHQPGLAVADVH